MAHILAGSQGRVKHTSQSTLGELHNHFDGYEIRRCRIFPSHVVKRSTFSDDGDT